MDESKIDIGSVFAEDRGYGIVLKDSENGEPRLLMSLVVARHLGYWLIDRTNRGELHCPTCRRPTEHER